MSNIPISSLPIAISLSGSEAVVLDQAGTTKTATVSLINAQNVANIPAGGLTGQGLVKSSNVNYATMWKTVSGFGTVQEVDTGTGLTGGPITLTGTISLAPISAGTLLANVTGGSAAPIPNTPSSVLDVIGNTQGDILYRSASGWTALAPGSSGQILTSGGAAANPAWSAVGSGTVTSVSLALPSSILTVTGSPVTVSGTLTGSLATQSANLVWAGPTTGTAATPTFRSLVGADLPNPGASSLGGIESFAGSASQWIRSISTSGVPASSQPAFSDISGVATGAQLPNPSPTTLGGIESLAAVSSRWINQISTSGVPSSTQPAFSDLSGNAALAQLPSVGNNTILSNISGGSATPLANSLSSLIDTIGAAQGDILYRNASVWTPLTPGTNGQVLTSGGAAANPSWTTVTGTGTVTSIATNNGITGGTITASGTIGLATIATGNVLAYTSGGTGVPVATVPSSVLDVIGSTEGNILYRGASTWSVLAPGTNGQYLQTSGAGSTPSWAGAVNSIAGNTGAFTLNSTSGITNSTNSIILQQASSSQFGAVKVDNSTIKASSGIISTTNPLPTPITNSLSGNVALNNTANYFDGPSVAQGTSGTWWASGTVTVTDTGSAQVYCKLWDGTTVIASTVVLFGANVLQTIGLSGFIASPAGNIRMSCRDISNTTGNIIFNQTGNSKDSTISAFRIA